MQCIGQRCRDRVRVSAIAIVALLTLAGLQTALAQVRPFDNGNSPPAVAGVILTRYALGIAGAPLVANTGINAGDAPSVEAVINCPSCGLNITGHPTIRVADAPSSKTVVNEHSVNAGTRADPLLAVDMNRVEIVSKLMIQWQGDIAEPQRESFKQKFDGLRADRLLAVSLVGSFDGVLEVLYGQEKSNTALSVLASTRQTQNDSRKTLGDVTADLVYTPITPCRILDTRTSQGGPGIRPAGSTTAFNAVAASFAAQGGAANTCNIPAGAAAMAGTFSMLNASSLGFITLWAVDTAQPAAASGLFNPTSQQTLNSSASIVPLCTGAGCTAGKQFNVFVSGALDVAFDVTGYFKAPGGVIGDVTEVNTGTSTSTGLTGGTTSGIASLALSPTFKLPQACTNGQVPKFNTTSALWECQNDATGGSGTVTSVATGSGLTGGPITATGTINLAATQLLPTVACATNQIAAWNGSAWICSAPPPTLPASCLDGQLLKLQAGAIVCSAAPQTFTTVDSVGAVGQHMSIAKSLDGMPIISYFDVTNSSAKVIKCGNAACSGGNIVNTVDNSGALGRFTAIAVPSDGFPVISYSSSNNPAETVASALKVAKCVDVSCTGAATLTVVDSSAVAVGRHSSMAISADGFPVISYYDGTNGTLKVAKCVNATCAGPTITTLDGIGATDVGRFTSITVPVDGLPVISYLDVTNFDLKVVKCSVANCSTFNTPVTVDGAGASLVGEHTSIAKSADGFPIIAYFSNSTFALKVAKCINAGCTGATLVNPLSGGVQGSQLSIAVPADGLPVISHAVSGGGLRVVKCGNASCTSGNVFSSVDPVGINGAAILVPASDNLPVIAYDDRFNSDLKVVKCSNSGCANP